MQHIRRALIIYLIAILLLIYSKTAVPEMVTLEWWQDGEFGWCTATDIRELGGCGLLIVKRKPRW